MKKLDIYPLLGAILLLSLWSCQKAVTESPDYGVGPFRPYTTDTVHITKNDSSQSAAASTPSAPFPQAPLNGCYYAPIYGDTIIFPQPTSKGDDIVTPVNNPGAGKFMAWPGGLMIDSVTGVIDLTQSQTGMKYAIGFIKSGTTDTCLSTLVVGGASYADSIYVLNAGQTTASPYFDANPSLLSVCSTPGACSFDVTGSAAKQKVVVDNQTGVIDLQKTLNGGLLGGAFGLLPVNGSTITTTIFYRLNDPSNNALQQIQVQLEYYDSKSGVNIALLNLLAGRLDNLLSGNLISTSASPRPPLIVITHSF